jgi:hypothetical protein
MTSSFEHTYLLGHGIRSLDKVERDKIRNNTFILALDGDIDFKPEAFR